MKRNLILGLAIVSAIAFVSCKSSESSYRKAYEKAQAQTEQQVVVETPAPAVVTTPTPAPVVEDNTPVRSERLNALNGNLKAYNVVCGSFKSLDNANRLAATLVSKGYSAQVAQNPETGIQVLHPFHLPYQTISGHDGPQAAFTLSGREGQPEQGIL